MSVHTDQYLLHKSNLASAFVLELCQSKLDLMKRDLTDKFRFPCRFLYGSMVL